ncbi:hypothetical protein [Paenibacillus sp. 32O-W]|uniref:hypothetical protein n=1 Tax=Paenibacillus sp. 32O-W TaxID=1695218 RepID=UPI00119DA881|nr:MULTISPECIES: hypothetical protein [Paenibacillaceae]
MNNARRTDFHLWYRSMTLTLPEEEEAEPCTGKPALSGEDGASCLIRDLVRFSMEHKAPIRLLIQESGGIRRVAGGIYSLAPERAVVKTSEGYETIMLEHVIEAGMVMERPAVRNQSLLFFTT